MRWWRWGRKPKREGCILWLRIPIISTVQAPSLINSPVTCPTHVYIGPVAYSAGGGFRILRCALIRARAANPQSAVGQQSRRPASCLFGHDDSTRPWCIASTTSCNRTFRLHWRDFCKYARKSYYLPWGFVIKYIHLCWGLGRPATATAATAAALNVNSCPLRFSKSGHQPRPFHSEQVPNAEPSKACSNHGCAVLPVHEPQMPNTRMLHLSPSDPLGVSTHAYTLAMPPCHSKSIVKRVALHTNTLSPETVSYRSERKRKEKSKQRSCPIAN